jgi:hypothetical protein
MDDLAANAGELRVHGFKALVDALGWPNAVRFLRLLEPGVGNYSAERDEMLPEWEATVLVREAHRAAFERGKK